MLNESGVEAETGQSGGFYSALLSSPFLGKQEKEINNTTYFLSVVFIRLTSLQWSQPSCIVLCVQLSS